MKILNFKLFWFILAVAVCCVNAHSFATGGRLEDLTTAILGFLGYTFWAALMHSENLPK